MINTKQEIYNKVTSEEYKEQLDWILDYYKSKRLWIGEDVIYDFLFEGYKIENETIVNPYLSESDIEFYSQYGLIPKFDSYKMSFEGNQVKIEKLRKGSINVYREERYTNSK
jgi:hypothetical protein